LPYIHPFIHRRWCQPCKVTTSMSAAVRVKCLAQGHLDTWLGRARGSNQLLPDPLLPPELLPSLPTCTFILNTSGFNITYNVFYLYDVYCVIVLCILCRSIYIYFFHVCVYVYMCIFPIYKRIVFLLLSFLPTFFCVLLPVFRMALCYDVHGTNTLTLILD